MDHDRIREAEQELGPRDNTRITTENRQLVRRWLTGYGVTSKTARGMTLVQLSNAYAYGAWLDDVAVPGYNEQPAKSQQPQPKQEDTPMTTPTPTPTPGAPDVNQIAAMLSQLMGGSKDPVDRAQVAAIIEEMAPDLIAKHSRTLKIEAPDREPVKIEGAHKSLSPLVTALSAGCKVWLAGPAGSGKTTLAQQAAKALGLDFYSTGALSSDFRLTGFMDARGEYVVSVFRQAFENGGLFLLDEADASNPNVLVAINQALENDSFAFPDGMVTKSAEFRCVIAANTYGSGPTAQYVGRTRIDAATIDRFFFLTIDYDADVERALAGGNDKWLATVRKARQALTDNGLQHIISPRAVRDGAQLLAAGMDRQTVALGVLRKGLDDNAWAKVKSAAGV
jgi:cobaltochelatase CobS